MGGGPQARLLSYALAHDRDTQSSVFGEQGMCAVQARRELTSLIETAVPTPGPRMVCLHANEDSKALKFDWSKKHCPDWSDYSSSN